MNQVMDFYWDVSVSVYDWIINNYDQAKAFQDQLDQSPINTAFEFCNGDNGLVTGSDITECSMKISNWADMDEHTQNQS